MRKTIVIALTFFIHVCVFGETGTDTTKSVTIQGDLTRCSDKYLVLYYGEGVGRTQELIQVETNGHFYYNSLKIKGPIEASLAGKMSHFETHIFMAPGYDLAITADCTDYETSCWTKKISGYGSIANKYLFVRDSLNAGTERVKIDRWSLRGNSLLNFLNTEQKIYDSIVSVVFTGNVKDDPYTLYFKKQIEYNIQFDRLRFLANSLTSNWNLSYQETTGFLTDNMEPEILNNMYDSQYLISPSYKLLMENEYAHYVAFINEKKHNEPNPNIRNRQLHILQQVANVYQGPIKEQTLERWIKICIESSRSFDELKFYEKDLQPLITLLNDSQKEHEMDSLIVIYENRLIQTQIGKSAPTLLAYDYNGDSVRLSDLRGKVIFIDLWASRSILCRRETPYLNKLVEKYKDDDRIVFIMVALLDDEEKWKVALRQDRPRCMQLFVKSETVNRDYMAYTIPRFVIIDKRGDIVDFDAPRPSENSLEGVLNAAIEKGKD